MNNLEKYNSVFCEVMHVEDSQLPELQFKKTAYWDSIGHMTLIAALEETFDIMLETEDMMSITSYSVGIDKKKKNYGISF